MTRYSYKEEGVMNTIEELQEQLLRAKEILAAYNEAAKAIMDQTYPAVIPAPPQAVSVEAIIKLQ